MIESHTVPESLLNRFAYCEPNTDSLRLWRYAKGRPPYPKQSPKSATRYGGHFADPDDPAVEQGIEKSLARNFEEPVNKFVHLLDDSEILRGDERRAQLTRYVTLLFLRSKSRRKGAKHIQEVKHQALERFLSNESQLLNVATKWNIDLICRGVSMSPLITKEDVASRVRECFEQSSAEDAEQQQYLAGIRIGMSSLDEAMYRGDWKLLTTTPDNPFIISDSPVVTWQRDGKGAVHLGGGFHRADVEILLPVSPTSCIHILPEVERFQQPILPTVDEVNFAQAAFAYRDCFANMYKHEIDDLVQKYISTARIGDNVFTVWHRNYDNAIYETLMRGGRWVDPPRF